MSFFDIMRYVSARSCYVWLAVLLLGLGLCPVALPITTALSASNGSFFGAFTDPNVNEILVTLENYQLSKDAWSGYTAEKPYVLDRDLLIRSSIEPYGQLDFAFLMSKVLIASNVTLTFRQLILRNIKKLSGFGLDFFMGQENSTIVLDDVVRVKFVCNPVQDALDSTRTYTSFPPWPPNKVSLQSNICIRNPEWESVCYQDNLLFENFTFLVSRSDPEAGFDYGGYVLHMNNTTRVCDYLVTEQCMDQYGLDTCMAQLLDEVINGTQTHTLWTKGAIAGVAVAGAVVLVVIAGAVFFRTRLLQFLVRLGGKSLRELDSTSSGSNMNSPTTTLVPSGPGGSIRATKTTAKEAVRLGVLLGSGSFGRVYRGRWHGTDVAVKIISCAPGELTKVLKEAEVMMQLQHPNIVRAFQCSVFKPFQQRKELQTNKSSTSTSSPTPQVLSPQPTRPSLTSGQPTSSTQQRTSNSGAVRPPAAPDSVIVNIMPDIVQHRQRPPSAAAGVRPSMDSNRHSNSSQLPSASGAAGGAAGEHGSGALQGSSSTSSSEAARRLFNKVFHPLQQHQQQQQQQAVHGSAGRGPSTRSFNNEGYYRRTTTPVSSAAAGSGSLAGALASPGASLAGASNDPGSSANPAGSVSFSAPVTLIPMTAAGSVWQQRSTAVAGGTAGTNSSLGEATLPSGAMADVSSPTAVSHSSQLCSSGPLALGEGRDGTAWSNVLRTQRTRGSASSRAMSTTSGSVDTAAAAAAAALQQSGSGRRGSSGGEIQPAAGWFPRMRRASTGSIASGAAGQRSSGQQHREQGPGVSGVSAGHASEDSEEERKQEVQVWLVLELCNGGTLKDAVSEGNLKTDNRLELAKLLCRLLDAANGMAYLHSRGILHGDLKAGNVLLFNSIHGAYGQISKISDFGLAATLMDGATHRSTASMGTITHMAPEVLRSGHMSAAGDVYSFGIMMWEVYTNKQAHAGLHYGAVVERVIVRGERPPVPSKMPPEYAMLMTSCWDGDAAKRPTFTQILQCIELLLDNLTSDSERISEGSEDQSVSSSIVPADPVQDAAAASSAIELSAAAGAVKQLQQQQAPGLSVECPGVSASGSTPIGPSTSAAIASGSTVGHSTGPGTGPPSSAGFSGAALGSPGPGTSFSGIGQPGSSGGQSLSLQQLQDLQRWQLQQQEQLRKGGTLGEYQMRVPSAPGSSSGGAVGRGSGPGALSGSGASGSGTWGSGRLPITPTPQQAAVARPLMRPPAARAAGTSGGAGEGEAAAFVQDL